MVAAFRKTLLQNPLAAKLSLSERELGSFETHYNRLQQWNSRMNLTGLKGLQAIVERHFLEPLATVDLLEDQGRLVDLGSGNGFPAIPLKIMRPGLDLVLVESSEKKSAFLWAVLREIGLKGARVETRRVRNLEDLTDLLPCRYLTLRAVRAGKILEGERNQILVPGGRALLFVTDEQVTSLLHHPIPGLRLAGSRPLPSNPRSVLAILEPETS